MTTPQNDITLCVGTVIEAELIAASGSNETRLTIDFGEAIGERTTVVDLALQYYPEVLIGRQIVAIINAGQSITILGANSDILGLTLVSPDRLLPPGTSVI